MASSKLYPQLPNKLPDNLANKPQSTSAGQPPADLVIMGRILAPRGIKGWLKIKTFSEEADALADFDVWWLKQGERWSQRNVEETELVHLGFSAKLEGVDDRNAAELMRGIEVAVSRGELPDHDDAIYWVDLIGLEVVSLTGEKLGTVDSLMETGANDVLVVKSDDKSLLIPYTERTVHEVDLKAKRVVVEWQRDW